MKPTVCHSALTINQKERIETLKKKGILPISGQRAEQERAGDDFHHAKTPTRAPIKKSKRNYRTRTLKSIASSNFCSIFLYVI